jgi:excinuclease ABC subunit C
MSDFTKFKEKIENMPESPGVYLMKDAAGNVLYVGKAKVLPRRVISYFQKHHDSAKTARLVSQVADLDYMVTNNEKEALILENTLIKKHKPRYNINLRDDKTYPSLKLTVKEEWPRLEVVRRIIRDGSVYFGPFSSATSMRQTIRLIRQLFPLRQCRRPDITAVDRPCLNHQLGRCLGPCSGKISHEEYRSLVDDIILFFRGKNKTLTDSLREKMNSAAQRLDFEAAARYRDRLKAVEKTLENQKMVTNDRIDRDVIGLARQRGQLLAVILFIRAGVLLGRRILPLPAATESDSEIIDALLGQYYSRDRFIPDEILVPAPLENKALLAEWLRDQRGKNVLLHQPTRGLKKQLIKLAEENAATSLADKLRSVDLGVDALMELQQKLHLPTLPKRIEGYDMSSLRGEAPVGAMVVLEDGTWIKSDYRRYKIKSASGQDDYAMMFEVLGRRLAKNDPVRPDLILLDGGRGQLGVAQAVIRDMDIDNPPPLAGLAKGRDNEPDRVWLPGRKNPVDFKTDSAALLLLMRIRDEAHRYVRTYHHHLRSKGSTRSILDDIPGVGPARRKALLDHFGSLEAVKKAGLDDLIAVQGIPRSSAEAIHRHFHLH